MSSLVLSSKEYKSLILYIKRKHKYSATDIEPSDILNETVVYLLEHGRPLDVKLIAASTFYAIRNIGRLYSRYYSILKSEKLKHEEEIRQETYNFYTYEVDNRDGYTTKRVKCLTTNKTFNSVESAARHYNTSGSNILKCLKGIGGYKSAGTYNGVKLKWEYT